MQQSKSRRAERGVSMLFALMALGVLMLGAAALVRSVDTGVLALGNLTIKQDATATSFIGADEAIDTFLKTRIAGKDLDTSATAAGYSAASMNNLDPTGRLTTADKKMALIDWLGDNCSYAKAGTFESCTFKPTTLPPVKANGEEVATVRYFITRLCATDGPHDSAVNSCLRPVLGTKTGAADRGAIDSQHAEKFSTSAAGPYYRVIVRTDGKRGTVSYTETLVHF